MRYKLDSSGYVCAVAFGSYLDDCKEYTGDVPSGYKSLEDWASNGCIQAYYIDVNGNLTLDLDRKLEIENKAEQEAIDNSCVLRKDIFDTEEAIEGQYIREIASGKVIVLEDIKTIAPKVKITGITGDYEKLSIYAQGKNMMPCHAESCVISGVTFTKNASGSLTILGTAKSNIEYVIADGKDTTLFALKPKLNYYLNLGGLNCELSYFDGETTAQQYIGKSGLLNLPKHVEVTKVVIKIPSGESLNKTFYPQLEYGNAFTSYESHKLKALEINIGELQSELVYPSDDLYADDDLYPGMSPKNVDYILVENGKVSISVDGKVKISQIGSMGLFSAYNTIYATKDVNLEVEYSANFLLVDSLAFLQGKATTTNQFKILEDGSIEAHNGYFSGTINATDGVFKGRIEADSGYFNGSISWSQITNADSYVTTITQNTITTEYLNTKNIKAGSVDAKNITGDTISGKTINGGTVSGATISGGSITIGTKFSVDSLGTVTANSLNSSDATITGGKIGGFIIDTKGIRSGKVSVNDNSTGVYIGTDGINVGYNSAFKVTDKGDVTIGNIGDLKLGSSSTISFTGGTISIEDDGVYLASDRSNHFKSGELKVGGSYNYYTTINQNKITFGSGSTAYLYHGSNALITMNSLSVTVGTSSSKVGFFGLSGTTKQKVSKLSSPYSATVSDVATKLNSLIDALNSYGLISSSSY